MKVTGECATLTHSLTVLLYLRRAYAYGHHTKISIFAYLILFHTVHILSSMVGNNLSKGNKLHTHTWYNRTRSVLYFIVGVHIVGRGTAEQ